MPKRKIIKIDEEKCTGCGQCVIACAEGALEIVDGKAKLVGDLYCDGLGACIGDCPEDALEIIEREAVDFDEEAAMDRVRRLEEDEECKEEAPLACGCPGTNAQTFDTPAEKEGTGSGEETPAVSRLGHFPVKLQLLNPSAPFLEGADLLLLADCVAAAYPDLHARLLAGRAVAMGCPKLDDLEAHIEKLVILVKEGGLASITVARMEVPCCRGFLFAAQKAVDRAEVNIPVKEIVINPRGAVITEQEAAAI